MPNKPNKIKRSYLPERKPFERIRDNSWFYNSYKWRKFTKGFKQRNPLCIFCKDEGIIKETEVVDHKFQYQKGELGWNLNELQDYYFNALCTHHHNVRSGKQRHGGMG